MFDFAALSWSDQTQSFLRASAEYQGRESYYGVFRNTSISADKWKGELSAEQIDNVLDIANQTRAGRLFD